MMWGHLCAQTFVVGSGVGFLYLVAIQESFALGAYSDGPMPWLPVWFFRRLTRRHSIPIRQRAHASQRSARELCPQWQSSAQQAQFSRADISDWPRPRDQGKRPR